MGNDMDENGGQSLFLDDCNFMEVKPAIMALPYPPVRARGKNLAYANLLSLDYCGFVSEMSAIAQYINNESRLSGQQCSLAQTMLGIAMAEMIHLQKLGQLISLLGGSVDYVAREGNGKQRMWSPEYVALAGNAGKMLQTGIESEQAAIRQYRAHIKMIKDDCVNALLARIIRDEEYHIMVLRALSDR